MVVQKKHLFPRVFHYVLAEELDQESNGNGRSGLVSGRQPDLVDALIREEHFKAATRNVSLMSIAED